MEIIRYITVKAIKRADNVLIPLWQEGITYEKDVHGSKVLKYDNVKYYSIVEAIFDLKTKNLSPGVELDYYPDETEYKVDQIVMQEQKGRVLSRQKVVDVVYEEYDLTISKGEKLDPWYKSRFELEDKTLYAIKSWKPYYILDNGAKIKWAHELYKIQE